MIIKYLKYNQKGGFTLIELLVVIAIISLVSSVVLISVNSARDKAKVSAIKENVATIQNQASLYYNEKYMYHDQSLGEVNFDDCMLMAQGSLFEDQIISKALLEIASLSKINKTGEFDAACAANSESWYFTFSLANLQIGNIASICFDSAGKKNIYSILTAEENHANISGNFQCAEN